MTGGTNTWKGLNAVYSEEDDGVIVGGSHPLNVVLKIGSTGDLVWKLEHTFHNVNYDFMLAKKDNYIVTHHTKRIFTFFSNYSEVKQLGYTHNFVYPAVFSTYNPILGVNKVLNPTPAPSDFSLLSTMLDPNDYVSGTSIATYPSQVECWPNYSNKPYCNIYRPKCGDYYSDEPEACGVVKCIDADKCEECSDKECNDRGTCVKKNPLLATCSCNQNYFGERCQVFSCNNVLSNETMMCSGHGECKYEYPNKCFCNATYFGENCEKFSCDSLCSGHGECIGPNSFNCSTGYLGSNCSEWKCGIYSKNDRTGCSNHGDCLLSQTCRCDSGYFGDFCEFSHCFGVEAQSSGLVCSGHGICTSKDSCQCSGGYYGVYCNVSKCFEKWSNDTSLVCSGHGKCQKKDDCICKDGYTGKKCEKPLCESLCSGHGVCYEHNKCNCTKGYVGKNCSEWKCGKYHKNNREGCSNHGKCILPQKCDCENGYYGDFCGLSICFGTQEEISEVVCSGHGKCEDKDLCRCNLNYYGLNCSITTCNEKLSNETNLVCSGDGKCSSFDKCYCKEGYYGKWCEKVYSCQTSETKDDSSSPSSSASSSDASSAEAGAIAAGTISFVLLIIVFVLCGGVLCLIILLLAVVVVFLLLFFVLGGGGILMSSPWFLSIIGFFGVKVGKRVGRSALQSASESNEKEMMEVGGLEIDEELEEVEPEMTKPMDPSSSSSSSSDDEIDLPVLEIVNKSLANFQRLEAGEEVVEDLPMKKKKKKKLSKKERKRKEEKKKKKELKYLEMVQESLEIIGEDENSEDNIENGENVENHKEVGGEVSVQEEEKDVFEDF